jgi:type I restriction enzyme R subunit
MGISSGPRAAAPAELATMTKPKSEGAFEATIEAHLLEHGGWLKGSSKDFDPKLAVSSKDFFAFVEATQAALLTQLHKAHGEGTRSAMLDALIKAMDTRGSLDVIRHGFKFYGKTIRCAYFKPAHGLNEETLAQYRRNRLVVTRQVFFSPDTDQSIDMMLSINGLPVATVELKNHLTGQTYRDSIEQYKHDRDPTVPLLQFKKRALVHFAVDPEVAFMATELRRSDTYFLPFNRGRDGGAGNPQHPSGHRTAYLWEEVWQFDSFLEIVGRFIHLQVTKQTDPNTGKTKDQEVMVFPRYHQLDAVRQLEVAARDEGAGNNYLIQHSAGSGKSNSIAWLAHRLASLHDQNDNKVFDSVVVVTDRRVLDTQLQNTIYQFEHKGGVVERIDKHSKQLATALESGTPIIITTLQKFPFVTEKIGKLPSRRYAIIADEAHSSQTGEASRTLKEVLAVNSLEEAEVADAEPTDETEDAIEAVMRSRGRQKNLSFFAFTATPKAKTLEIFGRPDSEGKPVAFHLYSMRQAIEERFILDVLKNYTTYKSFYRLAKQISDDPDLDKKKATKALARFMSLHPTNIAQKVEIMIEHFRLNVRHKIDGRAKAMVVTSSRLHAVRYKRAFDAYIKKAGFVDMKALVAFSGTVHDEEVDYTEPGMNDGISEGGLPEEFAKDDYKVLLVANKYQTGFDQPLLHTMYVDKRLAGVQAVQTLSRLNRTCRGKEDTFVLDFVNDVEEIHRSFQPFYEQTAVAESADPQELYRLQAELDASQIYWESEIEAFAKVFYKPQRSQREKDNALFYKHVEPAVDRFTAAEDEPRELFRNRMSAFVKLYSYLAQIMPFQDADLEKRYTFLRALQTRLPLGKDGLLTFGDEVELTHIHRKKTFVGAVVLQPGEMLYLRGPVAVGTAVAKDEVAKLSTIVEILNDRLGTDFKPADQLTFDQYHEDAKANEDIRQKALANSYENFALSLKAVMEGIIIDRMERNEELSSRYLNDSEFQQQAFGLMARRLYDELRAGQLA